MYLRDGLNIALEALVLGITVFKTFGLRRLASRNGINLSLGDMLLQDGRPLLHSTFPEAFLSFRVRVTPICVCILLMNFE